MRPPSRRLIEVKVQPRAKRREVIEQGSAGLTVKVTAAPDRGQANEEVRRLLAEHFGLPASKVLIIRGEKSRHKIIALEP
jgi:uncharacterized protein (TIGR00251 family)